MKKIVKALLILLSVTVFSCSVESIEENTEIQSKVQIDYDMYGNIVYYENGCGYISYKQPDGTYSPPVIDPNIGCI